MNPNSREEYEKTLAYAKEHNYIAMYNAMVEDGYDPSIDWQSLRKEPESNWRAFLPIAEQECRESDEEYHEAFVSRHEGQCDICEAIARACEKVARAAYQHAAQNEVIDLCPKCPCGDALTEIVKAAFAQSEKEEPLDTHTFDCEIHWKPNCSCGLAQRRAQTAKEGKR